MRGKAVRHEVFAKLKSREAPFLDNARDETDRARTDGEVKFWEALEDVRAHPLDGAAHTPRELLCGDEVANLADCLFLGLLADGTAVYDYEFCVLFARRLLVSGRDEKRLDSLAVADVHLATVRVYVEFHSLQITAR